MLPRDAPSAPPQRLSLTAPPIPSCPNPVPELGTIRYTGPLPPNASSSSPTWLGVEWDNPTRGKHAGVYFTTGEQVFSCQVKGSGSFIRDTTREIQYGVSFQEAVRERYLDSSEDEGGSTFHATSSNFKIEVPSLSRVRRGFAGLKVVGLERCRVDGVGDEDDVMEQLAAVVELNLSYNLLSSWGAVEGIVDRLPSLKTLVLNSNRFARLRGPVMFPGVARLKRLDLNSTLVDWQEIVYISPSLTGLVELQLANNRIKELAGQPTFPALESLNLDSNDLYHFHDINDCLGSLPLLKRLILSSNRLSLCSVHPSQLFLTLEELSLAQNGMLTDHTLRALSHYPKLKRLWVASDEVPSLYHERRIIIIVLERLEVLDGSPITSAERTDAELLFISRNAKGLDALGPSLSATYGRLLDKHGSVELKQHSDAVRPLKPESLNILLRSPLEYRRLSLTPTTTIRTVRSRLTKYLLVPLPRQEFRFVAILHRAPDDEDDDEFEAEVDEHDLERTRLRVEIPTNEEGRELRWWGISDGDELHMERVEAR